MLCYSFKSVPLFRVARCYTYLLTKSTNTVYVCMYGYILDGLGIDKVIIFYNIWYMLLPLGTYILWPFGIFYCLLVYFMAIGICFCHLISKFCCHWNISLYAHLKCWYGSMICDSFFFYVDLSQNSFRQVFEVKSFTGDLPLWVRCPCAVVPMETFCPQILSRSVWRQKSVDGPFIPIAST
jgi:hypothetical protein